MKLQRILTLVAGMAAFGRGVLTGLSVKNPFSPVCLGVAGLLAAATAQGQVPQMMNYQGRISTAAGEPYNGNGYFKFALVDAAGAWYWSNDGSGLIPPFLPEPANAVQLPVQKGLYSVKLGDTLPPLGMFPMPPFIFQKNPVFFRMWFSAAPGGPFMLITAADQIVSVGYAMNAQTVVDGAINEFKLAANSVTTSAIANNAITGSKIASGAVSTGELADNSVTSAKLADNIDLGNSTGSGGLRVWSGASASPTITVDGSDRALVINDNSTDGVRVRLEDAVGGQLTLYQANGTNGVRLKGERLNYNSGGTISVAQSDGGTGVSIDGQAFGAGGGKIIVYGSDGQVITLAGNDSGGKGRITTQILEITGGGDLSENFDISGQDEVKPGMVVCVDPVKPGNLVPSSRAYDRTAAGVVSGAGGVRPGMLMGQVGSVANGKHPVALTGRVYCQADASNGVIQPGDLLTTSDRPGHAMKVTDHARAQGAIIGKAMSRLDKGSGLVLVLVSLQ